MKIKTIIIVCLVLVSCKKEISHGNWEYSPDCDEVFDTTIDGIGGDIFFTEDSIQFKFPTFNPDNPDEILYQYIDYTDWTFQLKKYNIKTGLNQVLLNDVVLINPPAWSRSGKIVFEVSGNQLYLTDEFGAEPVLFGPPGVNQKPAWIEQGQKVVFYHQDPEDWQSYILSVPIDQYVVDTIKAPGSSYFVISNNMIFLLSSGDNFYSLDLKTADFFTNADLNPLPLSLGGGGAQGMCWSADGTKFYVSKFSGGSSTPSGLYEVEYPSGAYKRIITYCSPKLYTNVTCSPNGNYLIGQRLDCYQVFNSNGGFTGEIVENSSLYLFNPSTGMEIKLDLE